MASDTRLAFSAPPHFVLGSSGADSLTGTAGSDIVYGGRGDDTLAGGGGTDMFVLRRGEGSDIVTDFLPGADGDALRLQNYGFSDFQAFRNASAQSGADVIVTLPGGETLTLRNVEIDALLPANLELDKPLPSSGDPANWQKTSVIGSTLSGTPGNDQLTAEVPEVTLIGGSGDDTYFVWNHTDTVVEEASAGIDTVRTYGVHGYSLASAPNVENLSLTGSFPSSALGNELGNLISGNDGDNRIDGALGNDVLVGGGGRDTFVVHKGEGSDVIADFRLGARGDTVALAGFDFENFSQVVAAIRQVGSDAMLDLGDGSVLTFRDSDAAAFTAENFSLGVDTGSLVQTFVDEFETLDRFSDGSGTWRTRYEWWGDGAFTLAQNGEQQIYVDTDFRGLTGQEQDQPLGLNPFSLVDGQLVITAQPIEEPSAATRHFDFTSGMISSQSSFWQTYGYFEMTAELPAGTGAWPAFWMLPVDNSWPPELDILEAVGDQPDQIQTAVIGAGGTTTAWSNVDSSGGAHSYGMLWTPYEITFYFDGVETMSVPTPTEINDPMYLLANLAVGGVLPGTADPDLVAQFAIDKIAAYQLPEYTLDGYTLRETGKYTRYIEGTYGAETLQGTAGNDFLNGRMGADALIGGLGDDTYNVNDRTATVYEKFDGGIDTIRASIGFALPENVENLHMVAEGEKFATGNALPNIIVGNSGKNVITGGLGNDILTGNGGPDTFVFRRGDGSDIITDFEAGSKGSDLVRLEDHGFSTFDQVRAAMTQVGGDTHLALSSFETLVFRNTQISAFDKGDFLLPRVPPESQAWIRANIGTEGADEMFGSASNERFEGKGEADLYAGGLGDDTYLVDNADQQVRERPREGIDTIEAFISYTLPDHVENLALLRAGTGTGNELANRMLGSAGDDLLNGKAGNDYLAGGGGSDLFVFAAGNGSDLVTDFNAGEQDSLRFEGYGENAYLTNVGDAWTIHYSGGTETFHLAGVTSLSQSDYVFA